MTTPKELGNRLKKARRAKKWRTRDLYRLTKINEDYIKDFEEGKFNFLPQPYIRAFLRTIATTLGLDPEAVLEDFEEILHPPEIFGEKMVGKKKTISEKPPESSAKGMAVPKPPKSNKPAQKEQKKGHADGTNAKKENADAAAKRSPSPGKKFHKTETFLSVLVIFILLAVGYVYWRYGRHQLSAEKKPVKEITVFEARKEMLKKEASQKQSAPAEPVKAAATKPKESSPNKVTLAVKAVDTTWVRVIRDRADTSELTFYPGNRRHFTADSLLQLKMGRADGLLLWVNGDSVGALGRASQIVSKLVINRTGIQSKKLRGPTRPAQKQE